MIIRSQIYNSYEMIKIGDIRAIDYTYSRQSLEGTKNTGEIMRAGGGERTREREREEGSIYRFNNSGSFSIPSTRK